jgi:hypothetical protein
VRFCFCNFPTIESFINKRTATYVGKIARSDANEFPKKFLGAWMNQPRKIGGQQLLCNNNFANAIKVVVPNTQIGNQGLLFKEWVPITMNEEAWLIILMLILKPVKQMMRIKTETKKRMVITPLAKKTTPQATANKEMRTQQQTYQTLVLVVLKLVTLILVLLTIPTAVSPPYVSPVSPKLEPLAKCLPA